METLHAPALMESGVNVHGLVTLGIAAIAVWAGWKIFRNLTKNVV
ncbi:MAG: hypothetical protein PHS73_02425 [Candidatus Peribacteraceae bacterium]|nr:hypothetical protein [Candidatus Peribacteraceae bacterium]